MRKVKRWVSSEEALKEQLRKGNPVILLKNEEHKDGCLGSSSKGWNLYKISLIHTTFSSGIQRGKVAIMPGWSNKLTLNPLTFQSQKDNYYMMSVLLMNLKS